MKVEIINKNSYGGEIVSIKDIDTSLLNKLQDNEVKVRFWENEHSSFTMTDISKIKDKKFKQEMIDFVEETCDYDIYPTLIK